MASKDAFFHSPRSDIDTCHQPAHKTSIEAARPTTSHISKAPASSSSQETAPALASTRAAFSAERTSAPIWGASAATAICARPFGTGVKARTVHIGLTTCDTEPLIANLAKVALRIVVAERGGYSFRSGVADSFDIGIVVVTNVTTQSSNQAAVSIFTVGCGNFASDILGESSGSDYAGQNENR
ncbi:hypothetical protein BO83DRAFT_419162 [Aspergillus eucalypticola CBS 122712]|uniref:Uncharacterized protein n=1 Tax=Aspergillus eucalypticola (strain CBS 122712 / IBT 29274) TaxID=1448314 RepID=A0A317V015_ASPEC|nr:uncharacterized protein BO83DRAFT_419162 [Aspergillus eucalypticola CBS 122712]PWY67296.1 hypothetical protein BO83DRAFT_419162 [Aspergillus eucalypticola CBS 122712]